MRKLLFVCLVMAAATIPAADAPPVSKITSHPLADVRAVMELFCAQAPTNVALRPFVSSIFGSGGTHATTNQLGEKGIGILIFDCHTISPGYEILATVVSIKTTRIEVRSLDASPDEDRREFRPKRNARVMQELVRLLARKP